VLETEDASQIHTVAEGGCLAPGRKSEKVGQSIGCIAEATTAGGEDRSDCAPASAIPNHKSLQKWCAKNKSSLKVLTAGPEVSRRLQMFPKVEKKELPSQNVK
jgi:hypothetical protein